MVLESASSVVLKSATSVAPLKSATSVALKSALSVYTPSSYIGRMHQELIVEERGV